MIRKDSDKQIFEIEDAETAQSSNIRIRHNSTGTPTDGFGVGIEAEAETDTAPNMSIGGISWLWHTATHSTRVGMLKAYLYDGPDSVEVLVISPSTPTVTGNARGAGAIDIQANRSFANGVAAAFQSTIVGGVNNQITVAGNGGAIFGGNGNYIAASIGAILGGTDNNINGEVSAIVGGDTNTTTGALSGILGGATNESRGEGSVVLGGTRGISRNVGQVVSGANLGVDGGTQGTITATWARLVTHSDFNWYSLYLGGNSSDYFTIEANEVVTFNIQVTGATSGLTKSFAFVIEGAIKNDGGTTSLLGTPTVTTIYNADDTDFDARVIADDTNDALVVQVQDSTSGGDTVRWAATIRATHVLYS